MEAADTDICVEVVYSPQAGVVRQVALTLPAGSSLSDALKKSGLPQEFEQLRSSDGLAVGVWGKSRALSDTLVNRDRVEVYRPLLVDPKEARRQRYQSHRVGSSKK